MTFTEKLAEASELVNEVLKDMETGNYDIEALQSIPAELEEIAKRITGVYNVSFFKQPD